MQLLQRAQAWAHRLKLDGLTLWFAAKHPETPWAPKALGALVVAYAFSPIDLIPDFIPVLGYLDDLLLLPMLIWLAIRWLPPVVLQACRAQAETWIASSASRPRSLLGAIGVVMVWLLLGAFVGVWVVRARS